MKFEDQNLFSIDPKHISRIRLAVGIMFLIAAFFNFFSQNSATLSTGRWSWIYRTITATFGFYGYPVLQAVIGLACIAWSRHKSSKD